MNERQRLVPTGSFALSLEAGVAIPLLIIALTTILRGELAVLSFFSIFGSPLVCGVAASAVYGTGSSRGAAHRLSIAILAFIVMVVVSVAFAATFSSNEPGHQMLVFWGIYMSIMLFPYSVVYLLVALAVGASLGWLLGRGLNR